MSLSTVLITAALIITSVLGAYILYKNPKNPINKSFALFMSVLVVGNVGSFMESISKDGEFSLLWDIIRIGSITALMPFFLFLFAVTFLKQRFFLRRRILLVLVLLPGLLLFILMLIDFFLNTNLVIETADKGREMYINQLGWGVPLIYLYFILIIAYVIAGFLLSYHKEIEVRRKQIRVMIMGLIISSILTLSTFFFYGHVKDLLSSLISLTLGVFFAFAIVKYKTLVIEPIKEKTVETIVGACGAVCSACDTFISGACPGCYEENQYRDIKCTVFQGEPSPMSTVLQVCVNEKGLKNCLDCTEYPDCKIYQEVLNNCPFKNAKFEPKKGYTYIVKEDGREKSMELFVSLVKCGVYGLCLTKDSPRGIRERYGLEKTPIILMREDKSYVNSVSPKQIPQLLDTIVNFLIESKDSAVLIDDLQYLIDETSEREMLEFTRKLADYVVIYDSRLILPVKPSVLRSEDEFIKTANPVLELNLFNTALLEIGFSRVLSSLPQNTAITDRIKDLKKMDEFFAKMEIKDKEVHLNKKGAITREELINKSELIISVLKGPEIKVDIREIFYKTIERYGFDKLMFKMKGGTSYLVKEDRPIKSLKLFRDFVEHGIKGLCFTRMYPDKLPKEFKLDDVAVLWLSRSADNKDAIDPQQTVLIVTKIQEFIDKNDDGVILLDGLEYLISQNGYTHTMKFIQSLNERIAVSGARLIVPVNPEAIDEKELNLLEREMEVIYPSEDDYI